MIQLDRVSKSYGARVLFQDLSWRLSPGRRIGLIGANGAGKTTLFRILSKQEDFDSGRLIVPTGATLGLLPQEVGDIPDLLPLPFVLQGKPALELLAARIEALTQEVDAATLAEDDEALARLTTELGEASERFRAEGGWQREARAAEILRGMGFNALRLQTTASRLSGGWKVRLVLSQLLYQRPSVLLMDEPTNHLDLPSVEWLESFLGGYEGTVVVISHDRYFLNRLVNEIAAIEADGFWTHPGGYDSYQAARVERLEFLERQKEQQDKQIKETERFIERFRSKASKAKQVQSRVRALDKVERIETPESRKKVAKFRFAESPRSGRVVCKVSNVAKRFGELSVYESISVEVERAEKLALVGPNGAGKSTLLKLMTERMSPDAGSVELGHQVVCGYFGQHQVDELDNNRTVLQEMEAAASMETQPQCRSILGAFLFQGDDVQKKVAVLSGGERNRLALARMLLVPSNFLLLDEPTNHLDIESRDVLEQALNAYTGTIVFVSHDRHFINAVATRVVHVEEGILEDYRGDYEYYQFKRSERVGQAAAESGRSTTNPATPDARDGNRRDRKRREAELRQELAREAKKPREKLATCEAGIAELEGAIATIQARMADPTLYEGDGAVVSELQRKLATHKLELDRLYYSWAELSEAVERVESVIRARYPDLAD